VSAGTAWPVEIRVRNAERRLEIDFDDGSRFSLPAELLRVAFLVPAFAQALDLRESGGFVLIGSEAEMQRSLAANPDVIEAGLNLVHIELPTDVGGIDLLARDSEGRLVVVELKRGKAGHEAVHQLWRYVQSVRTVSGEDARGVLAAPDITVPALNRLGALGLEFKEVRALPGSEERQVQTGLF